MVLAVVLSALAGALLLVVLSRLPDPWDTAGLLGVVAALAGPAVLLSRSWSFEAYAGAAAGFIALALYQAYGYLIAASDAKVREIVRGSGRRVPPL